MSHKNIQKEEGIENSSHQAGGVYLIEKKYNAEKNIIVTQT
jgi:hypothetical protein